jgi:hypothetical protein
VAGGLSGSLDARRHAEEDHAVVASASRELIRRIVLDYGFWDRYLDRPWVDINDDPPELDTELALLTVAEMTLEVRMLQNPNLMTLFLRQGDERLPELGYDDNCAQWDCPVLTDRVDVVSGYLG